MSKLSIFGFQALWSPFFFFALFLVVITYFLITVKYRNFIRGSEPLTVRQAIYFLVAIVLLYVIKGSPLDLMGHLMFYAHMIQMAFLYLVIPPLFIVGIPQWIWKRVLDFQVIGLLFSFFTKPLLALILFNGMFSIYHIPLIFDTVKTDVWLHSLYTGALFLAALFMWWPLLNEVCTWENFGGLKKIGYIFANGVLITPACVLIIFADSPIYLTYSDPKMWTEALQLCVPHGMLSSLKLSGPEIFHSMSLIDDQQLGGILMKILQEVIYGAILAKVFFSWYQAEQGETEAEIQYRLNMKNLEGTD